jgi:hypothetical protein
MTKQEWSKLSQDQKLDRINDKMRRIEVMQAIKISFIILGVFGLMAVIEGKAQDFLKKIQK